VSTYICPACGYPGLDEEPWEGDTPSDDHCPSCGIQFGYQDLAPAEERRAIHRQWRRQWVDDGMNWHSRAYSPPHDWDPMTQLAGVEGS
jgi:hypothetical protein